MHYNDELQKENQILKIVVYKHSVLGKKPVLTKKGVLHKDSVHYAFCSIQECKYFDPNLLVKIIQKPFKYLNDYLTKKEFEKYYELVIKETEYNKIEILSCNDVTNSKDEFKFLH